jgi:hypothetical protein
MGWCPVCITLALAVDRADVGQIGRSRPILYSFCHAAVTGGYPRQRALSSRQQNKPAGGLGPPLGPHNSHEVRGSLQERLCKLRLRRGVTFRNVKCQVVFS